MPELWDAVERAGFAAIDHVGDETVLDPQPFLTRLHEYGYIVSKCPDGTEAVAAAAAPVIPHIGVWGKANAR